MPGRSGESYFSGVFLQITARPNPRLTAAALRHGLRRPVLLARVAGWAAIGLAVLDQTAGDGLHPTLLLLGVVLAVGIPVVLITTGTRRTLGDGPTTYEITDGGVAFSTVRSRHAYAWNALTGVDHLPGQLVFRRGRARFVPVPTAGLDAFQIHEVLRAAAAHGLPVNRG